MTGKNFGNLFFDTFDKGNILLDVRLSHLSNSDSNFLNMHGFTNTTYFTRRK